MTKLRFAPSPTGYLHLGNIRTALINWLYARSHNGKFILRLDDTDVTRSQQKYAHQIEEDLFWLGLSYDTIVKQSERLHRYEEAARTLEAKGRLYACYETSEELELQRKIQLSSGKPPLYNRASLSLTPAQIEKYKEEGRKPHWRFKMEKGEIFWKDLIRGDVVFQGELLNDPILFREDGSPVFTIATSVDDLEMGITHIIRGEDHVSNTAVQIQIMEALSGVPHSIRFGHLALISGREGEGLSKREGSLSLMQLRKEGIEPMAINSLLAKLGTSDPITPHTNLEGILVEFDIKKFGRATPKLDPEDLWQMNIKILQLLPFDQIQSHLNSIGIVDITPEFWNLIQNNIVRFHDIKEWWVICYGHKSFPVENKSLIEVAEHHLPPEPWGETTFKAWMHEVREETGLKGKDLFMPIRRALTGQDHGPELKDLILLMGRTKVLNRLQTTRA
ncbi:MAG: glutamate--tRNA ligase [Alphaproteobacteria bacterium]|nr:glutamate--tRNA ligase [Alphaproteobacteria bacterium]